MARDDHSYKDVPKFDGTRDKFPMWKSMMILYLKKKSLLGYIVVDGYDGSQAFTFEGETFPATVRLKQDAPEPVTPSGDSGPGDDDGGKKKKKKKRMSVDIETDEDDQDRTYRVIAERADVSLILMESIPSQYATLVGQGKRPFHMWNAIVQHFGSRGPTDYSKYYEAVFLKKLRPGDDSGIFVYELDSNILAFQEVIDTSLSDKFKSLILQHALPASWDNRMRSWLGTEKILSYKKLQDLVIEEAKRMPDDLEQEEKRRKTETAYIRESNGSANRVIIEVTTETEVQARSHIHLWICVIGTHVTMSHGISISAISTNNNAITTVETDSRYHHHHVIEDALWRETESDLHEDLVTRRLEIEDGPHHEDPIARHPDVNSDDRTLTRDATHHRGGSQHHANDPDLHQITMDRRIQTNEKMELEEKAASKESEDTSVAKTNTKPSKDAAPEANTKSTDGQSKETANHRHCEAGMMSAEKLQHDQPEEWIIDSGCSSHLCKTLNYFVSFSTWSGQIISAANPLNILGRGTVRFYATDKDGTQQLVELKNVYYVPRVSSNLLSVAKAQNLDGYDILFKDKTCELYHRGGGHTLVAPMSRNVDLYVLRATGD
ncbi:hypothetical protein ATCC90586_010689 [Pythium insidiosum]|nr:hypothetical protein ATCC90586_010689 [Pythium insidiosum]